MQRASSESGTSRDLPNDLAKDGGFRARLPFARREGGHASYLMPDLKPRKTDGIIDEFHTANCDLIDNTRP